MTSEDPGDGPAAPSMLRRSATGIAWLGTSQILAQLIHVAFRVVLARLLTPEDFGVLATALVVIAFTSLFGSLGLSQALVQRQTITRTHLDTAFWVNVGLGAAIAAIVAALSPVLGSVFRSPGSVPVIAVLSVTLFLGAPTAVMENYLVRHHRFRPTATRRVLSALLGGSAGVAAALVGWGVWALVVDTLTRTTLTSVLLMVSARFWPRLSASRSAFQDLWTFGRPLFWSHFPQFLNRNLDTILVSRYLGQAALGLYNIGYQFVLMPLTYIAWSVSGVMFPTFSRLQGERERLASGYITAVQATVFLTLPLMALLSLEAGDLVPGLLGEKWAEAVPVVRILCWMGAIQSVLAVNVPLYQAVGRPQRVLHFNIVSLVANTTAFLFGLRWGILGVATLYLVATAALAPVSQFWVSQLIPVDSGRFCKSLGGITAATVVAGGCTALLRFVFLERTDALGPLWTGCLAMVFGATVYVLISLKLVPDVFKTARRLWVARGNA